jgi:hypothetical protein
MWGAQENEKPLRVAWWKVLYQTGKGARGTLRDAKAKGQHRPFGALARSQWNEARKKEAERITAEEATDSLLLQEDAPPERLTAIAQGHLNPARIYRLMAHPNTPPSVLLGMLHRYPMSACIGLCHNPALPLLPLEMPDFITQIGYEAAILFLLWEELPPSLARWLKTYPDPVLAWEAEAHVAIAGEVDENEKWRSVIEQRLTHMVATEKDRNRRCELFLASMLCDTPEWFKAALALQQDPLDRAYINSLPVVPDDVLREAHRNLDIGNPASIPHQGITWTWLNKSSRFDVERYLALNLLLLKQKRSFTASHKHIYIHRDSLVDLLFLRHPHHSVCLEKRVRERLLSDLYSNFPANPVLQYAFRSQIRELPMDIFRTRHGNFLMRLTLTEYLSPDCDTQLVHLQALAQDSNRYVRAAARERLRIASPQSPPA